MRSKVGDSKQIQGSRTNKHQKWQQTTCAVTCNKANSSNYLSMTTFQKKLPAAE